MAGHGDFQSHELYGRLLHRLDFIERNLIGEHKRLLDMNSVRTEDVERAVNAQNRIIGNIQKSRRAMAPESPLPVVTGSHRDEGALHSASRPRKLQHLR